MMGDLGKLIAAKGFQKLPKVQKIARSGHTGKYRGVRLFLAAAFPSQTAKNVKRYYTLKVKAVNR